MYDHEAGVFSHLVLFFFYHAVWMAAGCGALRLLQWAADHWGWWRGFELIGRSWRAFPLVWGLAHATIHLISVSMDSGNWREIPWVYFWTWELLLFLATVAVVYGTFTSFHKPLMFYSSRLLKYLVKFWGPSNRPPDCWFGVLLFSLFMLSLGGLPSMGPDLVEVQGTIMSWLGMMADEQAIIPRYPRPTCFVWLFLTPFAFSMIFVSWVLTRRDEVGDWLRKLGVKLGIVERAEARAGETGERRGGAAQAAAPAAVERNPLTAKYWATHGIINGIVELIGQFLFH